ncbi:MAG: class II aldolase/adducin family protein [Pseudomonadota bacterium]
MKDTIDVTETCCDLAAAMRWFARLGMNEGIANHVSMATEDGSQIVINPAGRHWAAIRASDFVTLDAAVPPPPDVPVERTAWAIHGALHRNVPGAGCVMHLHSRAATALSCLADPTLPPVDQNAMRFFNRVSVDLGYDGMGLGDEAERLSRAIGNHRMLMMGQHGVLAVAQTVGQCFDALYYFEKAADTYLYALSTGRPLNIASDAVAEKTAQQWEEELTSGDQHLAAIREVLDAEGSDYAA